ncbi:MAG: A24 family peptidase [Bdellovibrionales bacterium]
MTLTEMWFVATGILLAGMVDDLRSRKVHNQLLVVVFPIALICSFYFRGFDGTMLGIGAFIGALIITIPLFAAGILGGGDVKLFAVFGFCVDPSSMLSTLLYSFIWGAVFGLTRAALQGQLLVLVRNTYKASRGRRTQTQEVQKIPYTFALLLGWFTQLTLLHASGLL